MASRGVNKVIIIGNVGNDPETRYFPDGGAVTNASIATSEVWKDKQTGQPQEKTEWHRVSFRDRGTYKLGALAGEYLKKGSKVYVEGRLQTRKWQDKAGVDHYTTEIIAEQMQFLSPAQTQQDGGHQAPPQAQQRQQYAPSQGAPAQHTAPPPMDGGFFDDDIPF